MTEGQKPRSASNDPRRPLAWGFCCLTTEAGQADPQRNLMAYVGLVQKAIQVLRS